LGLGAQPPIPVGAVLLKIIIVISFLANLIWLWFLDRDNVNHLSFHDDGNALRDALDVKSDEVLFIGTSIRN
jgi:hypothetical protein